jgi:DegV family protein with EDD domain
MTIAIVTDSTADIPREMVEKNHITVVPAILVVDGRSLEDGHGITREEFYARMPTMQTPPTTATPSRGTFENIFESLLRKGYKSILSIHVSSLLSSMYSTAKTASQSFSDQIQVLDSGQLSLGIGYQVLAAAEAAAKGLPLEAVIEEVERIRQKVRVIAMLDTLEYVRRSGRVSWVRARIGSFLNIKPFMEVKEGQVLSLGQVRTRKKGINGLINIFLDTGAIEKLTILHTNTEGDAYQLLSRLKPALPEPALVVNVTTIVGTHIGPNALGFAVVRK